MAVQRVSSVSWDEGMFVGRVDTYFLASKKLRDSLFCLKFELPLFNVLVTDL